MKVQGNLDSVKKSTLEYIDSFIGTVCDAENYIPLALCEMMKTVTVETGREIAVCLDRRGTVLSATLGEAKSVSSEVPDVGKRSDVRLCGVRHLHTHPTGNPMPSDIDLNTLKDARYDAMIVIGVNRDKDTVSGISASVLGRADDGSLRFEGTLGPVPPSQIEAFNELFAYCTDLDRTAPETNLTDTASEKERAILVGVLCGNDEGDDLAELSELAKTAGAEIVGRFTQKRPSPDTKYYVGSGMVEELFRAVGSSRADVIIFDDELSPSQIRNLEDKCKARIIDRTALILDIFAGRATSREGRLQVELAQQKYRLPRLTGLGTSLSRLGGGIGTRGPGETKLQTDRRHIMRKIHYLETELEEVSRRRELLRRERKKREVPTVSLVGYTNSGKSTLLNALCDADVYVENQLFATLDPSVRRMTSDDEKDILLVDTVGFIKKLPHELVEAFKSTLEEAVFSDLLVHVVDMDCGDYLERIAIVEEILTEIGASGGDRFLVLNKIDKAPADFNPSAIPGYLRIFKTCALDGRGLDELRQGIADHFAAAERHFDIVIPYSDGATVAYIHENGTVEAEEYTESGTRIVGRIGEKAVSRIAKYLPKDDTEE